MILIDSYDDRILDSSCREEILGAIHEDQYEDYTVSLPEELVQYTVEDLNVLLEKAGFPIVEAESTEIWEYLSGDYEDEVSTCGYAMKFTGTLALCLPLVHAILGVVRDGQPLDKLLFKSALLIFQQPKAREIFINEYPYFSGVESFLGAGVDPRCIPEILKQLQYYSTERRGPNPNLLSSILWTLYGNPEIPDEAKERILQSVRGGCNIVQANNNYFMFKEIPRPRKDYNGFTHNWDYYSVAMMNLSDYTIRYMEVGRVS